jgi:hypothetical protein
LSQRLFYRRRHVTQDHDAGRQWPAVDQLQPALLASKEIEQLNGVAGDVAGSLTAIKAAIAGVNEFIARPSRSKASSPRTCRATCSALRRSCHRPEAPTSRDGRRTHKAGRKTLIYLAIHTCHVIRHCTDDIINALLFLRIKCSFWRRGSTWH